MEKTIIKTDKAPEAIGPYSQAAKYEKLVFLSGQIPINPQDNQFMEGSISQQTELVISNLKAVLEKAGSCLDNVLKTTVYMKDLGEFQSMNAVYEKHFSKNPPARATVEVSALPKGSKVEIDCIAFAK